MGVAERVMMMIGPGVLVRIVIVRFRRDRRRRAAGAEPVATVVVSHPCQLRRQQVGGDERQHDSAMRSKHHGTPNIRTKRQAPFI